MVSSFLKTPRSFYANNSKIRIVRVTSQAQTKIDIDGFYLHDDLFDCRSPYPPSRTKISLAMNSRKHVFYENEVHTWSLESL